VTVGSRAGAGIAAACLLALGACVPALASTGAPGAQARRAISGDAGYVVTGTRFRNAEISVRLPHASRVAPELGSVGVTIQFWTARTVLDLKVVACTDVHCRPGGRPVNRYYRPVFSVYNRKTRELICSTSATGPLRCPHAPRAWSRLRFAPGTTLAFSLVYPPLYGSVFVGVSDGPRGGSYYYDVPADAAGTPTQDYSQARIGVELGASPWAAVRLKRPRSAMPLVSFDRPPPPPYEAEIVNIKRKAGGIAAPWWGHHEVRATATGSAAKTAAKPGPLWDDGYGFTVYLEP
jgi:hypothetical protein